MKIDMTVLTVTPPGQGGPTWTHVFRGHLSPEACRAAVEGVERDVEDWTCAAFTHHVLYADVSEDKGEVAAFSRDGSAWIPRQVRP